MATPLDVASESERNVSSSQHNGQLNENLTQKGKLNTLRQREKPVNILVIGSTGSGKSTLINAMLGKNAAKVGNGEKLFISEGHIFGEYKGVKITVYDTVGFGDTEGKLLDGHFDLILICSRLGERVERDMFLELASVLHEEMWKRTVVVLTFANFFIQLESVKPKGPEAAIREKMDQYKAYVVDFLSGRVKKQVLEEIPYCIAGRKDEKLPTVDDWLGTLWETCIDRSSDETRPLLKLYAMYSQSMVIRVAAVGALFGSGIGAKVGTVVPIVGTALGIGVGAVVGAIIGGVVGSFVEKQKNINHLN